eukprot:303562-Rhodomonas_salina.2
MNLRRSSTPQVTSASCLRAPYAMSGTGICGTEIAYGATHSARGTDLAYGATHSAHLFDDMRQVPKP